MLQGKEILETKDNSLKNILKILNDIAEEEDKKLPELLKEVLDITG